MPTPLPARLNAARESNTREASTSNQVMRFGGGLRRSQCIAHPPLIAVREIVSAQGYSKAARTVVGAARVLWLLLAAVPALVFLRGAFTLALVVILRPVVVLVSAVVVLAALAGHDLSPPASVRASDDDDVPVFLTNCYAGAGADFTPFPHSLCPCLCRQYRSLRWSH